jgi:hypothetical protein
MPEQRERVGIIDNDAWADKMRDRYFAEITDVVDRAEGEIDSAISMGLFIRGFEGAWMDDNTYALRGDKESRLKFQHWFGWDPADDVTTREQLGTIEAFYATGFDFEYVSKEAFARKIFDLCIGDGNKTGFGMRYKEVFQGFKTGDFGAHTAKIKRAMQERVAKEGGMQQVWFDTVFGDDQQMREEYHKKLTDTIRARQGEMEKLGNLRDEAIKKSHSENAGHYQKYEMEDGELLFIPVGWQAAREYVLGDEKKTDARTRLAGHFHEWSDVQQGREDLLGHTFGQGCYRIDPSAYGDLRGGITNYKTWDDFTRARNKKILAGIQADEAETDFLHADGWYTLGARDKNKKMSGMFLMYAHNNREEFRGKTVAEQEKLAVRHLVQKRFKIMLEKSPRDFLYALATAAQVPFRQVEGEGRINLRLGGYGDFPTINDLIHAINAGTFEEDGQPPATQISEFAAIPLSAEEAERQQNQD